MGKEETFIIIPFTADGMKAIFLLAFLALGAVRADDFLKDDSGDISMMSVDPTQLPSKEGSTTSGPSTTPPPSTTSGPQPLHLVDSDLRIPEEYKPARSYYYSYQAQVLTGIPEFSNMYSGFRLQCRVRLVMLSKRRFHMQLDRISFLQTNRIMPTQRPTYILSKRLFRALTNRQDLALIKRMLSLPVSFVWTPTGWIKEIRVSKLDTFWSLNIKKGLMTMLNLNLRVDPQAVLTGNGIFKRTKYFEDGIDGECKANYEYRRFPYDLRNKQNANRKLITISKVRDLSDCKAKPWFAHLLFLPEKCAQSRKPISSQAETRYRVAVSRNRFFFLVDMRTSSQYSFTERDTKDGSIASYVTQRCRYIGRSSSAQELLKQKDSESHPRGLSISMPDPESAKVKLDNPKILAAAVIQGTAVLKNYNKDNLDMYDRMRKFVELVRRLSKNDVKRLLDRIQRKPELKQVKYKEILYEIIPKAATKEVVLAFLDKIKSRQISDDVGAMVISRVSGMSFVSSERMIKQMMTVALSIKSPKQKETYKSLILTIGRLLKTRKTLPIPSQRVRRDDLLKPKAIKQFYESLLNQRSLVLSKDMHTIVVVSSLGNCGLRPCLDLIEPLLKPRKGSRLRSRAVRSAATIALQGSAKLEPKRVRKLALEVFYDIRENEELRLNAYEAFMATQPGLADLKLITRQLASEPTRQVRSFVATHLRLLSTAAKERCLAPLALNASRLLREAGMAVEQEQGLQFSRILGLGLPLKDSIALALANVKYTSQGFLPRQLSLGALVKRLGLNIDLGAIGLRADDAQLLLDRLLGADGTLRTSKTFTQLLKALTGRSKVDTDFLGAIEMYKGIYGINGISQEATNALKKGLIPVSKDVYRFATRGGPLSREGEILSFVDGITKIPMTIGMPFTVNHTLGAHVKLSARAVVKPKLLSQKATAALYIKGGASFRHQIYGGPDMTILRSYVSAMHQVHVPRIRSPVVIKLGWNNQRPARDQLFFRVNIDRPQSDKKIFHFSGRLNTGVLSRIQPRNPELKHMQHRSLQTPIKPQSHSISSEQLGLGLECKTRLLNFTGTRQELASPYYSPRDVKVFLKRDQSVGADKGVDVSFRFFMKRTNLLTTIGDVRPIDQEFQGKDNVVVWDSDQGNDQPRPTDSSTQDKLFTGGSGDDQGKDTDNVPMSDDMPYSPVNMTAEQRKDFYAEHRRLKTLIIQAVLKLDTMKNDGRPRINVHARRYISRGQLYLTVLKRNMGVSYSVLVQKRLPTIQEYYASGLVLINNAIRRAMFDERQPLDIIDNIEATILLHLRKNKKLIATLHSKLSMGDLWKSNVQRIIRKSNKVLPVFQDIQRCQRDLQRRQFGTPACYQAWKDINALTQVRSQLRIAPNAPSWLKQYPVLVLNYLRLTQSQALRFSKYEEPASKIMRVRCDWQLSPYDQRLVSGYTRVLRIFDHYVNARLLISRRNSIAQTPAYGLVSNAFDALYPAKCEVVRRGERVSWRTFDRVNRETFSPLASKAGRVVLVQDIKRRLLISEQKSVHHRVIQIRLKRKEHHVLIVVKENSTDKMPMVFNEGRLRRLPFKLYNKQRQLVLGVFRDATARSKYSLTAVMPLAGCSVRTNPMVSTEIRLTPFLFSSVRGICGDFNAEKWDDSKGPMCRAVYPRASSFLKRYTTLLVSPPTLLKLEKTPSMVNFMKTKQCPNRRYYPFIR